MFEGNSSTQPSSLSVNQGSASGTPAAASTDAWSDIHVMPSINGASAPTASSSVGNVPEGKRKMWLIIGGVVFGLIIIGVGFYFWWSNSSNTTPLTNVSNEPTNNPPPITTPPSDEPNTPTAMSVEERDRTRFSDIKNIQTALDLYFGDNKKYPIAVLPIILGMEPTAVLSAAGFTPLEQKQGTEYLSPVPKNPEPGGNGYLYESADGTTYTITFTLEQGAGSLVEGEHKATPQGFNLPIKLPVETPILNLPTTTIDTDGDGLTDAEEIVFGTDKDKIDSDSDTYNDGLEVDNDYDPSLGESKQLAISSKISNYQSERFKYNIIYPASWLAKAKDSEGSEIIFSGAGDEFIEVLVIDNPEHLGAAEWYAKQVPNTTAEQVPTVQAGLTTWVLSFDGLNAYLANDQYIFTLSYNAGTNTSVSYYKLFRAMLRSFKLVTAVE